MKASKQPRRGHLTQAMAIIAGALGVCVAAPAFAALGGDPIKPPPGSNVANAVVRSATVAASGASATSTTSNSTVRSTTLASGTVINEYLTSAGMVFGIAWRGPRVPDLATLLGSYFPQYQQSLNEQHAARGGRGPVSVQDSGLVVQSGGHMGAHSRASRICHNPCPPACPPATSNERRETQNA
ncbi:hypothetical protein BRCH_04417c [Candidatus Burkholderia brachyanthoides]|nr:hypothetical protein BRCH_04417c [Candidatus Burkholderia brachyanthoides]